MGTDLRSLNTRCCIVGGGPAGMMLGLLLARAGVPVIVVEKHGDFLRDFRGDTVHPSTLEILSELGLKQRFDRLPQHRVSEIKGLFADGFHALGDFRGLKPFPYVALVPQWDLLDLLADAARCYPHFQLIMRCEATGLLRDNGRVAGIAAKTPDGPLQVRAGLVIGCDGRNSILRQAAALAPEDLGSPMDVLWFRLPRKETDTNDTLAIPGRGTLLVMLNRNDYWQIASVIPKGQAAQLRDNPIEEFRARIAARVSFVVDRVQSITSWEDVKLLEVRIDRLPRWHRPGLLLIGDAAHAMSPIGGVGINLAIQDAVAAANILAPVLRALGVPDETSLAAVQRRRLLPTRIIQSIQLFLQRRLIEPALSAHDDGKPIAFPAIVRFLTRFRLVRSIPGRVFGVGFRREHIESIAVEPDRLTPR